MSRTEDDGVEVVFEDNDKLDVEEIVELPPGQEQPVEETDDGDDAASKVTLTKEEYDKILEQGNTATALKAGVESLANQLSRPQPVNTPPAQEPPKELDDETFVDEFFKPGKGKKLVESLIQQGVAQQTSQFIVAAQLQNKRLLKVDPETKDLFNQFEQQIEAEIAALPPNHPVRSNPNIYELAYQSVINRNQPAIIAARVKKEKELAIEEEVNKRLAEMGIKPPKPGSKPNVATYSETASGVRPTPKKKQLFITAEDRQNIAESGLDFTDPDVVRGYLEDKQRRKGGAK